MTRTASPSPAPDSVAPEQAARFAATLERLIPEGGRLGLAVSGGPDSLALLLLAQNVFPGGFEVATVDHGLRRESAVEAVFVAEICAARGIPHTTLPVRVEAGNLQENARVARYRALGEWAARRGLGAVATAHHADDQAETLAMRLNRASGLAGLAGVRERNRVPGSEIPLVRPLLAWRRSELAGIVERAGITAIADPSNADPRFDRARLRASLAEADWLDRAAWARSAAYLQDADEAVNWAVEQAEQTCINAQNGAMTYKPGPPRAIALRIVARIIGELGGGSARGGDIARLVDRLESGCGGNLGGVLATVENGDWIFRPEPPRKT